MLSEGYVQVYTGDGKGKTTAATGLAVRALSRGLRVCIISFLKGGDNPGECALLKKSFPDVTIIGTGSGDFVSGHESSSHDKNEAKRGLNEARRAMDSLGYDLVILDEIIVASALKLIESDDVLQLIKDKPKNVELVLTGRGATKKIID